MKKTKKMLSVLFMLTLLMFMSFNTISTAGGITEDIINAGKTGGTGDLEEQADLFAKQLVTTARTLGIIALVIMVIICGIRLMFGGEKGISTVKILIVPILLATFLVFKTESVVATILNIVDYTP